MSTPIIVFDLDGTLVDTAPDLLDSLNHCLAHAGLAAVDEAMLRQYVGLGGRVMLQRAFEAQGTPLDDAMLEALLARFLEHYGGAIPGRSAFYPGALEAMERFGAAGFLLAICTNKFERLSIALMQGLGKAGHFAAICGSDTFSFRKPDPRHLTQTILRAGGDPRRAVMVGDSQTDIDTARAARIPVVAVDWGYTDRHVRELQPSHIISHYDELQVETARALIARAEARAAAPLREPAAIARSLAD